MMHALIDVAGTVLCTVSSIFWRCYRQFNE